MFSDGIGKEIDSVSNQSDGNDVSEHIHELMFKEMFNESSERAEKDICNLLTVVFNTSF